MKEAAGKQNEKQPAVSDESLSLVMRSHVYILHNIELSTFLFYFSIFKRVIPAYRSLNSTAIEAFDIVNDSTTFLGSRLNYSRTLN